MAEENGVGSGSIGGGSDRLGSMDSIESRWVFQDDDDDSVVDDEDDDDDGDEDDNHRLTGGVVDSEDEDDNAEQRLIRTGPRIDSFDVEALEIPGAQRNDYEDFTLGRKIILACQTLGIVFGDVGTSPLYAFDVMFTKAPIKGEEDVLGALSLVLYTLILIPLIKYVLVVLWANDDGEGGTFALYSLICRHAKVSLLPNQLPSDARISSFRLKVPSPELERSLKIKERLETSQTLKKLLLILVLAGTAMVIADGVVTPAMSVMSAVGGLKVGVAAIEQEQVVMISVAFLVILFSVQKFGTSKVGLAVGPALFIWFCSLAGMGIYNLVKYDSTVLRAFNPVHIYYFFKRNSTKAWRALGGCLLCATGSEAMFADLCYFSVRSIQLTFLLLVLPCLLLGYLGQAAYLMENHSGSVAEQAFFSSVPSGVFWPVFLIANIAALIASRAMTTATFSCIKQSTALGCFPRLKIIHTSRKFMGQIYIPVINWFLLVVCLVFVRSISSITEMGNAYGIAELGVMMMTTILVTIVMLLIWQINIIIVLSFAVIFLGMELTFLSSVLALVGDGSWIILVFAAIMFLIMYIWNYGSKLKYETEVKQKLSMDLMRELGSNLGTIRAPGIGLLYNELVKGIPAIFGHFLTTLPAIHSMIIFVCIKYVPVPVVPQNERFLFRRVCPKSYHIFRCIARYGYKDVRKENHQTFEQLLIESLEKFIRREAQERSLESDGDDDTDSGDESSSTRLLIAPNGSVYSLGVPLLAEYKNTSKPTSEASTSEEVKVEAETDPNMSDAEQSLERELSFIRKAKESGVVYLLGHGDIRARKDSWFIKKLVINYFYAFLRKNCRRGIANLSVPHSHLMQVGMTYMV
ncbi:potassium transporter 7 [Ricinus communis]|uniref:Potassium transporter n=1 Tax=Ricinus communis TaxID=3988 RepID=B9SZS0_RICCO|nr:potassium transporter 7 [Ricinus communis]EEF30896.1 Potassium transporter, putative [Ricinus communis]|eukprot:XP_002531489.1 potassium transporter 7 [Ricinus communis]